MFLTCTPRYTHRMKLLADHRRAIDRLANEYTDDTRFDVLIIGGSVAKGFARPDSDVDFLIVATDDEFNRRRTQNDLFQSVQGFRDWGVSNLEAYTWFMTELEYTLAKMARPER